MKPKELRKLSDKELIKLKKDLEYNLMKSKSAWSSEKIKNKEIGIKGVAKPGQRTSLQKNIKRSIAQINTILRENE